MGIPFLDALFGNRYSYSETPYYGGCPRRGGFWGFGGEPIFSNPYAYRNYLGNMAYTSYGLTGMDTNMYFVGNRYNADYNIMNMNLFPENYSAWQLGSKMYFVYNPEGSSANYMLPRNDVNKTYQRYRSAVETGSKFHIDKFKKYYEQTSKLLKDFSNYAEKTVKCEDKERYEELKAKIEEMTKRLEELNQKMADACDGKDLADVEVLQGTDKVLKEFMNDFMSDCGPYKDEIDELMEEISKHKPTKSDNNDDDDVDETETETETNNNKLNNNEKIDKDNFPKVEVSASKKSGEKKSTSTNGDTEITTFKNEDDEVVRTVEITKDSEGRLVKEIEKDENGDIVKQVNYRKGKIESSFEITDSKKVEITYDKKGNVSEIKESDKDGNSVYELKVLKKGYKKTITELDGTKTTIEYDKDGLPTKKTASNGFEEEYKYSNGKKTEATRKANSQKTTLSYSYDEDNKLPSSATEFDKDGNEIATYEFEYDSSGRISEETKTLADKSYTVTEYEYDEFGRISETTVTKYDKDGNKIS